MGQRELEKKRAENAYMKETLANSANTFRSLVREENELRKMNRDHSITGLDPCSSTKVDIPSVLTDKLKHAKRFPTLFRQFIYEFNIFFLRMIAAKKPMMTLAKLFKNIMRQLFRRELLLIQLERNMFLKQISILVLLLIFIFSSFTLKLIAYYVLDIQFRCASEGYSVV